MLKQVIVVRRDLKMRRGKEISQCCHASAAFLVAKIKSGRPLTAIEEEWINGLYTKICLQAASEQELLGIYEKAKEAGLEVHLVTDVGKTEFHGINTYTAVAIGPDLSEKIDPITGGLALY